jgi:hypothetical protein
MSQMFLTEVVQTCSYMIGNQTSHGLRFCIWITVLYSIMRESETTLHAKSPFKQSQYSSS